MTTIKLGKGTSTIIMRNKDGSESIIREHFDPTNDKIIFKSDHAVIKMWEIEDLQEHLKQHGFKGTLEEAMRLCSHLQSLGKETADECDIIADAITAAEESGEISQLGAKSLSSLGARLATCGDCEHFDDDAKYCGHYWEKTSKRTEACDHFIARDAEYLLLYDDEEIIDQLILSEPDKTNPVELAYALEDRDNIIEIITEPDYDPTLWSIRKKTND